MSLEQLDGWLRTIEPPAKVAGTSMLDGYLTAVVIGPSSIVTGATTARCFRVDLLPRARGLASRTRGSRG
jgi:hypothetical protein